jgi:hypothetical protein
VFLLAALCLYGCGKDARQEPRAIPPAQAAPPAAPAIPAQDSFLRPGLALDGERQELTVTVTNVGEEELSVTRDALSLEVKTLEGEAPTELVAKPIKPVPSEPERLAAGKSLTWHIGCGDGTVHWGACGEGVVLGRGRYEVRALLHRNKSSGPPDPGPREWRGSLRSEAVVIDRRQGNPPR